MKRRDFLAALVVLPVIVTSETTKHNNVSIAFTPIHLIHTERGWVEIKDCVVGDRIINSHLLFNDVVG